MAPIDIRTLAPRVRAILADPQADAPRTGDAALDKALDTLAARLRAGQSLGGLHANGGYWYSAPPIARVHG